MPTVSFGPRTDDILGPQTHGSFVVQTFTAEGDRLSSVTASFVTYGRRNAGFVEASVADEARTILREVRVEASAIEDGRKHAFRFDLPIVTGKRYLFRLKFVGSTHESSVTCHYSYGKTKPGETFAPGGDPMNGCELTCDFEYSVPGALDEFKCVRGLVDVIVPVRNISGHLAATLSSIGRQTYNFFSVAVVDDASSPAQSRSIKSIVNSCGFECSLRRLRKHSGAPRARNAGAKKAAGEFLFFCDADVELAPFALATMVQALHDDRSAWWCYSDYLLGDSMKRMAPYDSRVMRRRNLCSTMSLIRRERFLGFDESLKRLQDWDLYLTMDKAGGRGTYVPRPLFRAVDRSDGITNGSILYDAALDVLCRKHGIGRVGV